MVVIARPDRSPIHTTRVWGRTHAACRSVDIHSRDITSGVSGDLTRTLCIGEQPSRAIRRQSTLINYRTLRDSQRDQPAIQLAIVKRNEGQPSGIAAPPLAALTADGEPRDGAGVADAYRS